MNLSFRATLLSLMLAVLVAAVATLGAAAYWNARFAVHELGGQVLDQAAARVEQHVGHALEVAERGAATLDGLLASGWLDPNNHEHATDFLLEMLGANPGLSYLSFGMPSGRYFHVFRDREGGLSALWLLPEPDGGRRLFEFSAGADGRRETVRDIADSTRTPPYERPYYRAAVDAGGPVWTEAYVFLGSGEALDVPGVSRSVPVAAPGGGDLLGVLTADFDLHALSRFLRGVPIGEEGFCFLVEIAADGTRRVLAHPDAADPDPARRLDLTEPAPDGEGRVTVRSDQIADSRVTTLLSRVSDRFGGERGATSSMEPISIEAGSRRWIGGVRPLDHPGGPNWVICMLVPEDELFGRVRGMARLMGLVALLGLAAATALSVALSRRIAGNLGRIAEETREIGRFQLAPKPPVPTRIREIGALSASIEEMKTGLRSFQKYVSADLVRLLLRSGREAELGGERRELTVYFSDLVGFTSISEKLEPEALAALLSEYLDAMTGQILENGGTVDKFIGDAIMAFWGAPEPVANHPVVACRTALANQARLGELRAAWRDRGAPELRARIGLHTGEAIVGNFGSPHRLDYTAIGDTVNLASRLEGLNRIYGTDILVSDAIHEAVGGAMVTRPLDRVAVKGREAGILVHELVGEAGAVDPSILDRIARYREALERYLARDFETARTGFESVLTDASGDVAARLMRDRCNAYRLSPPPEDWDGVFHAPK